MIHLAVSVGFVAVGLAMLLNLYRLALGPDIVDRILALDTLVVNAIGLIILIGLAQGTEMYFEAALLIALFGFVSSSALAKFLLRGEVIE